MGLASAKKTLIFLLPLVLLLGGFLALHKVTALSPAHRELLLIAPFICAVTGMLLSVHFHRGRPFTALLLVTVYYYFHRSYLFDGISGMAEESLFAGLAGLIPFNLALLALMRERGVFSIVGRIRLLFIAGQAAIVWLAFKNYFDFWKPLLSYRLAGISMFDGLPLTQPLLLISLVAMLTVAILSIKRQAPIESGLLGATMALLITMLKFADQDVPPVFCTVAALIITVSILQDSYNMAFRDDLTGIPSRRALNESLHGVGRRYVIAMLDVDHFKRFNDTYGHDVGDQVLKMVAKKIHAVGGGGKAYRYGGEEFTVLFSGRKMADALPHLENIRKNIEEYRLTIRSDDRPKDTKQGEGKRGSRSGSTDVSVTISIGVAESGEGQSSSAAVIKAADKALYRAKSKGRNQVCC